MDDFDDRAASTARSMIVRWGKPNARERACVYISEAEGEGLRYWITVRKYIDDADTSSFIVSDEYPGGTI